MKGHGLALTDDHPPMESQGSWVRSLLDWAAFQGSSGGGGAGSVATDEGPKMSTRSSMADWAGVGGLDGCICACVCDEGVGGGGWRESVFHTHVPDF